MEKKALCVCGGGGRSVKSVTYLDLHFIEFPCGHTVEKLGTELQQEDLFRRLLE